MGIDIGSVTSKALILDRSGTILAFAMTPTTYDREGCGRKILEMAFQQTGKSKEEVEYIVSTGYGRNSLSFTNKAVSEIICHAEGTKVLFPDIRTIIDIGGQDSKIIELDEEGRIRKFEMNDKCAAGTGRFLEVLSERILNVDIRELGPLSLKSKNPCTLSSVCTVFAESEVISYLSANKGREDIAYGLNRAIAKRIISMGRAAQIRYQKPICLTGGVAKNVGVVKAIEEELGGKVLVPEQPQITASLGAALLAKREWLLNKRRTKNGSYCRENSEN
ncbi:MAG: acyl-CoA dehydratase activase [Pseudomonadota bacterium]